MFAIAALGALPVVTSAVHGLPSREYDVLSTTEVPRAGVFQTKLRVRLTRVGVDAQGWQLVQMQVARGAVAVDKLGNPSDMDNMHLHRYPVLYWQAPDGQISSIHYDTRENDKSLAAKRLMLSHHQIVVPPAAGAARLQQWRQTESDVHGAAAVEYSARNGMMGRRVYKKTMLWSEPTPDRMQGMIQTGNATAIVDGKSGVVRRISMATMLGFDQTTQTKLYEAESSGPNELGKRPPGSLPPAAANVLPKTPSHAVWTLVTGSGSVSSRSRRRRRLYGEDVALPTQLGPPAGYASAGLQHLFSSHPDSHKEQLQGMSAKILSAERERRRALGVDDDVLDDELPADGVTETKKFDCFGRFARTLNKRLASCLVSRARGELQPCLE